MFNRLYETAEKTEQERAQLRVHDWRTNGVGVQLQVSNLKLFKLDTHGIARRLVKEKCLFEKQLGINCTREKICSRVQLIPNCFEKKKRLLPY